MINDHLQEQNRTTDVIAREHSEAIYNRYDCRWQSYKCYATVGPKGIPLGAIPIKCPRRSKNRLSRKSEGDSHASLRAGSE